MSNRASAQARANEFAHQIHESAEDVRDSIEDMGSKPRGLAVTSHLKRASIALMTGLAAILLVTPAPAAPDSTLLETTPSTWDSFGSVLPLPQEGFGERAPSEPFIWRAPMASLQSPDLTRLSHDIATSP